MAISKVPTGIAGFDHVTGGGLPEGRPTLVCGGPGCGKTLFATEFLVRGARDYGEPGVMITFEESVEQVAANVSSLGFDIPDLVERDLLAMDHIHIDPSSFEESGRFDLEGIFIRIGFAIDSVGATRVVLDTLEVLFSSFDERFLRGEIDRLLRFLHDRGVTVVITGEQGNGNLTRHGLEEYVTDCVVFLDHRVTDEISTRRLRVVKYRGTAHATREFPFVIDEEGFQVLPVTSMQLDHVASHERVSTGVGALDEMLGGEGVFRGSSILISGTPGTGKTTLAVSFAEAACARGERACYFSFEESPAQLVRNLTSVGLDLQAHIDAGRLDLVSRRPEFSGLEAHLLRMQRHVEQTQPSVVVVDPMNALTGAGTVRDVAATLLRFIDFLKSQGITAVFSNLSHGSGLQEYTEVEVSSLMDTWILLRDIELGGERNRGMYVLKSRGMRHSNQIREFVLGPDGIQLLDVYVGPDGVLTGAARVAREAEEAAEQAAREAELDRLADELADKKRVAAARLEAYRAELALEISMLSNALDAARGANTIIARGREEMRELRSGGTYE